MTKHNAISSTLTGVALGLLGLTGAGTGVSFALDCTASTVTSCNKTGCTSRAEQEEPFHFFLDLKRRRLDLSLPEASQAGTVRSVETSNAIALAGRARRHRRSNRKDGSNLPRSQERPGLFRAMRVTTNIATSQAAGQCR
jgi:hypothetical protein